MSFQRMLESRKTRSRIKSGMTERKMKKKLQISNVKWLGLLVVLAGIFVVSFHFLLITPTFAANPPDVGGVFGEVKPPPAIEAIKPGATPAEKIGAVLTNIIKIFYIVASIAFVFMFLSGAVSWIFSGGNKESVAKAKDRITHAIIGIILLALAFTIFKILGTFTGFTFFVV